MCSVRNSFRWAMFTSASCILAGTLSLGAANYAGGSSSVSRTIPITQVNVHPAGVQEKAAGGGENYKFERLSSGIEEAYQPANVSAPGTPVADANVMRKRLSALGAVFQISVVGKSDVVEIASSSNAKSRLNLAGVSGRLLLRPVICRVPPYSGTTSTSTTGTSASCMTPAHAGATPPIDEVAAAQSSSSPLSDWMSRSRSVILTQATGGMRLLLGPAAATNAGLASVSSVGSKLRLKISTSGTSALVTRANGDQIGVDLDGVVIGVFAMRTSTKLVSIDLVNASVATDTSIELRSGPLPVPVVPLDTSTVRTEWYGPALRKPSNEALSGISLEDLSPKAKWPAIAATLFNLLNQFGAGNFSVSELGSDVIEVDIFGSIASNEPRVTKMVSEFAKTTGVASPQQVDIATLAFE
jgi:hypothetical protein